METEPIAVAPAGDTTPDPVKKPLVATPTLDDLNLAGTWGLKVDGRDEGESTIEKAGQVLTLIARRSNASSTPFAFGTVSWSGKKLVFTSADANPFLVTLLAVEQGQWVVTASRRVSGGGEKEEYRTVVKGSARNEPDWKTWTADLVEATENPGRTGHLDVTLAHDGSTLTAHWSVGQGRVEFILTRR